MTVGQSFQIACPAKVNITLAVGRRDRDDPKQRHPIASRMVAIDLFDQLAVHRSSAEERTPWLSIRFAKDIAFQREIDWPLEHDLAYRAHALLQSHTGRPLPIRAELVKSIPTGAGLGGGSSDAAGMLHGLNKLFDLGMGFDDLAALGGQLGSDVPFALSAIMQSPAADVSAMGEQVRPVTMPHREHFTLVVPDFACPTAAVFRKFDELGLGRGTLSLNTLADAPLSPAKLFNDLTPAAAEAEPRLGNLMRTLRGDLGLTPHLTGSGSACLILQPDRDTAQRTADTVRTRLGVHAQAVSKLA